MSNDIEGARHLFLQALAAQEAIDLAAAEKFLRQALVLAPGRESILINLAGLLAERGAVAEGQELCERVLALNPDNPLAWMNLGLCQIGNDRPADAVVSLTRALALEPANPAARGNFGIALMLLDRMQEAVLALQEACRLEPDQPGWLASLGSALRNLQRHDEAVSAQLQALKLDPENALAHWNLAQLRLTLGDYCRGWQGFEWRWRGKNAVLSRYRGNSPRWDAAQPLTGKKILLWAEQGLGDAIQFCRFVPFVAQLAAGVILQVPQALVGLMQMSLPGVTIIPEGLGELPPHDVNFPLLSLPRALSITRQNIPGPILQADAVRVEIWRKRLGEARRPRIGVMWQGNLENRTGRNRSLSVSLLRPILSLPCEYFSLGKDVSETDRTLMHDACEFHCYADEISDFSDTAALCSLMDQVVTVDTSVAHLAASLCCSTNVLLPRSADWRWGNPRTDRVSPWYPESTRLFRQSVDGDWGEAIEAARRALSINLKVA